MVMTMSIKGIGSVEYETVLHMESDFPKKLVNCIVHG